MNYFLYITERLDEEWRKDVHQCAGIYLSCLGVIHRRDFMMEVIASPLKLVWWEASIEGIVT
jgi:hypothetical protein